MGRFTLQGAIRYDHAWSYYPEQTVDAARFFPTATTFPRTTGVEGYHELWPRGGVAIDVFGTGKTSVKLNFGRYLEAAQNGGTFTALNPTGRLSTTTTRTWTDNDRDWVCICSTSPSGSSSRRVKHRAVGGTRWIMDPHTGEILALANYPTFNPNAYANCVRRRPAQPGAAGRLRARIDLQDRHRLSGARGGSSSLADLIDTSPPGSHQSSAAGSRSATRTLRRPAVQRRDREVEQRRRDQGRPASRAGAAGAATSHRFGFGQRSAPTSRPRVPGIVWNPADLNDSALASVSMGYQIGVTPLQMAAAVSAIANGGSCSSRASSARSSRTAGGVASSRRALRQADLGRHGRDADRRSWRTSSSAAPARPRGSTATPSPARPARRTKLIAGRLLEVRLQRVVRRVLAVAQAGASRLSSSSTRRAPVGLRRRRRRADLPADRRSVAAAPGRRADDQSGAAGACHAPRRGCPTPASGHRR